MINAAIVGLGRWGRNLVDSVQGKSDRIRIVAGVTRTPDNAREYAKQRDFPLFELYGKILVNPRINAVILATPHTQRAQLILAAARAGKHVFTEKPFTLTRRDAEACVQTCADFEVTLAVGYNWRFQPALQEIRRLLDEQRLGKLLHIEGHFCGPSVYRYGREHWRLDPAEGPAGGMTGRGVHVVDAMLYLAGHIETVYAQSARRVLDYGIDDTTSMLLRFRCGASGYLGTVVATAETWRLQVFGSQGWAEVGGIEHLPTWRMRACYVDPENPLLNPLPQTASFPFVSTERAELERFADAVESKQPLAVASGDEVHGVAVLEAISESVRIAGTIKID